MRGRPLAVRVLLVLTHLRTNPTTPALAALFAISQPADDRIVHHRVPTLAGALRPEPGNHDALWIIDGTRIPAHDQAITAPSKNYRRSLNTQILTSSRHRTVIDVSHCWPGNRNDVIVARLADHFAPRTGSQVVLGRCRLPGHQDDHRTTM